MKHSPLLIPFLLFILMGCASRFQYMAKPPEDPTKLTNDQLRPLPTTTTGSGIMCELSVSCSGLRRPTLPTCAPHC